jgi:hypothetical protein
MGISSSCLYASVAWGKSPDASGVGAKSGLTSLGRPMQRVKLVPTAHRYIPETPDDTQLRAPSVRPEPLGPDCGAFQHRPSNPRKPAVANDLGERGLTRLRPSVKKGLRLPAESPFWGVQ